jgi:ornithine cyclodeaminase/alanine dehydrogenase-like protein (mu-crystallin family)
MGPIMGPALILLLVSHLTVAQRKDESMRILTAEDVRAAVDMRAAIDAVRAGFIALSTDRAHVPLRCVLNTPGGVLLTMPAHIEDAPISTVKIVSVCADNVSRGLPTIHAAVLVTDAQTGVPLALMDGGVLTALRTGAASGLATDLLARPDAAVLAVIGAGVQARTQIAAVCAVRPIMAIRIYSLSGAETLAGELRTHYRAEITVASSAHAAVAGAKIIVAATNSATPVIYRADLAPGAHINGIGSFTPEMQEVAADVVMMAKVVVDHRESIWAEAGDLIIPRDQGLIGEDVIHAEIGEIAAGLKPGRIDPQEITFFKSVGNAVQDAALAQRILAAADEQGLGTEIAW